jgi:homoserine O-acetyltransferase
MNKNTQPTRPHDPTSVGIVQQKTAYFDETLVLSSGSELKHFTLAYETYGRLNTERNNAILICHALSGDAHVAGYHTDDPKEKPGWWDDAVGPGKMFDTNKYFVVCSNVLGGCMGSTGPASPHPKDGQPYGTRFPIVTIQDMVQAQTRLIDRLGIKRLFAIAGGSMGGMQALEWAVNYPERVESCLFIASTPIASAQQIAFNEIGRQAIYADPNWNGGDYYDGERPGRGLAVARMVGHITYMSESSLDDKFGRRLQDRKQKGYNFQTDFAVESYLKYQGNKFIERFDANSYLYVTKALDYYDVSEVYGSLEDAVAHVTCPFLIVSFSSDWLYPKRHHDELAGALRGVGKDVEQHHIEASFGHDSFLVEVETMNRLVGGFLRERWAAMGR